MDTSPDESITSGDKRRQTRHITAQAKRKKLFLSCFVSCGSVQKSADSIGVDRSAHYRWMREDPEYPARFAAAEVEAARLLEDEGFRRAHDGVRRPVLHEGKQVTLKRTVIVDGIKKEIDEPLFEYTYSDVLLMFFLKGLKPDRYRERASIEHTGKDGKPLISLAAIDKLLSDDDGS